MGTTLGQNLQIMSKDKTTKGLKNKECERGRMIKRPPISYIPIDMDESGKHQKPLIQKILLPDGSQFSVPMWTGNGNDEQFLLHTIMARDACARKGLFDDYSEAVLRLKKTVEKLETLHDIELESLDATAASETRVEKKKTKRIRVLTVKKKIEIAESMFSTYTGLLGPEAKPHLDSIVAQQVNCDKWKNLQGVIQSPALEKSISAFNDCVTYHLLTCFTNDAAERQKLYMTHSLRKPNKVTIRVFVQRVQQLNSYLQHLPCLYDSAWATGNTKQVVPYNEADLSCMILNMCPPSWLDQNNLVEKFLPQDIRGLLPRLEAIEKCETGKPPTAKVSNNIAETHKNTGKQKRGGNVPPNDKKVARKKSQSKKYCSLCKKYGGAQETHNTNECSKYESDGKVKPNFGKLKKAYTNSSFTQLSKQVSKLQKQVKKKQKKDSRKRKSRESSDNSSDSDS